MMASVICSLPRATKKNAPGRASGHGKCIRSPGFHLASLELGNPCGKPCGKTMGDIAIYQASGYIEKSFANLNCLNCSIIFWDSHGSLNVPIEHHPTIRYMVYNGYYKVMSNIPKMGHLPTPDSCPH